VAAVGSAGLELPAVGQAPHRVRADAQQLRGSTDPKLADAN
jgi:hypothetical protein